MKWNRGAIGGETPFSHGENTDILALGRSWYPHWREPSPGTLSHLGHPHGSQNHKPTNTHCLALGSHQHSSIQASPSTHNSQALPDRCGQVTHQCTTHHTHSDPWSSLHTSPHTSTPQQIQTPQLTVDTLTPRHTWHTEA